MFSPALGRVVRSACAISGQTFCSAHRPATVAAVSAASQPFRPAHQRRRSSSKTSIPPDDSHGSSATQQPKSSGTKSTVKKVTAREGRKKATAPALNIPSVKATDHLQHRDVSLATFFSLHRPISVTHPGVPPPSTEEAFNSLFEPRTESSPQTVSDTLDTLSDSVELLEAAMRPHEELDVRDNVTHLDGMPQVTVDQIVSRLLPFMPPPAPVPIDSKPAATETKARRRASKATASATQPQKKSWSTTVVVTESTDVNGQRTYSASTTPMVKIEAPVSESSAEVEIHQPFLDRMKIRQNKYNHYRTDRATQGRADMSLISVKRQRKLKMKKHKYKKLMKRTRLLRRKLDKS